MKKGTLWDLFEKILIDKLEKRKNEMAEIEAKVVSVTHLAEDKGIIALNPIHPDQEKDLDNRFTYHSPFGDLQERYARIRGKLLDMAKDIVRVTPKGREQSLALTHLEEAMFWANAAIARNTKRPEPEPVPQPAAV